MLFSFFILTSSKLAPASRGEMEDVEVLYKLVSISAGSVIVAMRHKANSEAYTIIKNHAEHSLF